MTTLALRDVVVDGQRVSVRAEDGVITDVASGMAAAAGDVEIDGCGGAAIPGLHDHHVHLAAMAAADRSVRVDGDLDGTIRSAHERVRPGAWLRVVGYDEVRDGPLDRYRLDALAPGRRVRVQHRSGAMWVLSSAALEAIAPPPEAAHDGRLFRMDEWLRERIEAADTEGPPDVAAVARRLASYGITGVTDATPSTSLSAVSLLEQARPTLRVVATGGPPLAAAAFPAGIERGPVKIVIGDDALPGLDEVVDGMRVAHGADRTIAVHCVTRAALALAVAAWRTAGSLPGDRVEHASVAPPDLIDEMAGLGLTVVTQPGFVAARGDAYLAEVDPGDRPHLYRCAALRAAGIPVGASSDAPFGPEDPWQAMKAAVDRRTASGAVVGEGERMPPADALAMFLSPPDHPGGPPRRIQPGSPCDVVVLDCPLEQALTDLDAEHVRLTISAGEVTYARQAVR